MVVVLAITMAVRATMEDQDIHIMAIHRGHRHPMATTEVIRIHTMEVIRIHLTEVIVPVTPTTSRDT